MGKAKTTATKKAKTAAGAAGATGKKGAAAKTKTKKKTAAGKEPVAGRKKRLGAEGEAAFSRTRSVRGDADVAIKISDPHEHLSRVEAGLARMIEKVGRCPLPERAKEVPEGGQAFRSLVNAIVSQQLSGKAAETIFARVEALGGGTLPGPAALLALPDETLRGAGLSGAKTRGVKDLAARVVAGTLALDALHGHDDEAVIEALVKVKGIGRWTAEMFLMFRLGRPDVLSVGDLGLRKGMMVLFGLDELPDGATMERLSAPWRPFRSVASWYLWRIAEEGAAAKKGVKVAKTTASRAEKVAAKR